MESSQIKAPVVAKTMKLAREEAGYMNIENAVTSIPYLGNLANGKKTLQSWEAGEDQPTVSAATELAKGYSMPMPWFYLKPEILRENLPDIHSITDFRAGKEHRNTPELIRYLREVRASQHMLRSVIDDDDVIDLSWIGKWKGKTSDEIAKALLELVWQKDSPQTELNKWIEKAEERLAVAVLQPRPHHTRSIEHQISGLALEDDTVPIIVLNTNDTPKRRLFTLLHEIAHLMVKEPGISKINYESGEPVPQDQRVESLCNTVAAQALMPKKMFMDSWHKIGEKQEEDNIEKLSKLTGASLSACVVRAYHLRLIDENKMKELVAGYLRSYTEKREREKANLEQRIKEGKSSDRGLSQAQIALDRVGPRMTLKSLLAYDERRLSVRDLYDVFGVRLKYLPNIADKVKYTLVRWHPLPEKKANT